MFIKFQFRMFKYLLISFCIVGSISFSLSPSLYRSRLEWIGNATFCKHIKFNNHCCRLGFCWPIVLWLRSDYFVFDRKSDRIHGTSADKVFDDWEAWDDRSQHRWVQHINLSIHLYVLNCNKFTNWEKLAMLLQVHNSLDTRLNIWNRMEDKSTQ